MCSFSSAKLDVRRSVFHKRQRSFRLLLERRIAAKVMRLFELLSKIKDKQQNFHKKSIKHERQFVIHRCFRERKAICESLGDIYEESPRRSTSRVDIGNHQIVRNEEVSISYRSASYRRFDSKASLIVFSSTTVIDKRRHLFTQIQL